MTNGYNCDQTALVERVNGILKDEFLFGPSNDLVQVYLPVDQAVHRYNDELLYLTMNHLFSNQVH